MNKEQLIDLIESKKRSVSIETERVLNFIINEVESEFINDDLQHHQDRVEKDEVIFKLEQEIECYRTEKEVYHRNWIDSIRTCEYLKEQNKAFQELRPEIQWFALLMENQLQLNEHKGGWENSSEDFLLEQLYRNAGKILQGVNKIQRTVNTANFAMMIADKELQTLKGAPYENR